MLINDYGFTFEEIFDEIIGVIHAAHQTSHHTVCSTLYFIKKRPEWFAKLKNELEQAGVTANSNLKSSITREVIHEAFNLA